MKSASKKRPRSDEEDEDKEVQSPIHASDLTQSDVYEALCQLWNIESSDDHDQIYDELRSLYLNPMEPLVYINKIPHRVHSEMPTMPLSTTDPLLKAFFKESLKDILHDNNGVPSFAYKQNHLEPGYKKRDDLAIEKVNERGNLEYKSVLQSRYENYIASGINDGLERLDSNIRNYYTYLALSEYELENGPIEDDDYELSIVDGSCWTPAEKKRFFVAIERSNRGDLTEIARRVGPTKTVNEVAAYLNLLDKASKSLNKNSDESYKVRYAAREMSPLFMIQETKIASVLEEEIEMEKYTEHQRLLVKSKDNSSLKRALELFEVWNMSSLTHFFADFKDMSVLSSTFVQYYDLLKDFVKNILAHVHTELLNKENKIVSRALMNYVIAKRQRIWADMNEEPDRRLKELDIMASLDKSDIHAYYAKNKTASYLAKRRRKGWIYERDDPDDNDSMLEPFDEQDKLPHMYHQACDYDDFRVKRSKINLTKVLEEEVGINQKIKDLVNKSKEDEEVNSSDDEVYIDKSSEGTEEELATNFENSSDDDQSVKEEGENSEYELKEGFSVKEDWELEAEKELEEENLLEIKMKELDKVYEELLTEQLEFYNAQTILDKVNRSS
ncbi:MAG: hypothetical protein EXX96DRAFT_207318 [Benjaminiella poitrasii]|nr:MAG: hypothetical protein EXX96DRAFT_207318 [Benjaminiella poitrasii]